MISNYCIRRQNLVLYHNKNMYSVKSLWVQFFTTKPNLEKKKYDYFETFVFRGTNHTVGHNYFAHLF